MGNRRHRFELTMSALLENIRVLSWPERARDKAGIAEEAECTGSFTAASLKATIDAASRRNSTN